MTTHNRIKVDYLMYVEVEAKQLNLKHFRYDPLVRGHATEQGVLRNTRIIHIATHESGSTGFLAFSLSKEDCAKPEEILIYPIVI